MQHERILRALESANANLQSSLSAAQLQFEDLQAQLKAKEAKEKGKSNLLNNRKNTVDNLTLLPLEFHRIGGKLEESCGGAQQNGGRAN